MPFDSTHTCLPLTREVAHPLGASEGEIPPNKNLYFNTRYVVIQNGGIAEVKNLMTANGPCMEVPSVRVYKRKKE